MSTYRVRFQYRGSAYIEDVTCFSAAAARQAIRAKYPGCTIYGVLMV